MKTKTTKAKNSVLQKNDLYIFSYSFDYYYPFPTIRYWFWDIFICVLKFENGKWKISNRKLRNEILMPKDRGGRKRRMIWYKKLPHECAQCQWYHQRTNMILLNWIFGLLWITSILEMMIRFARRKKVRPIKIDEFFEGTMENGKLRLRMSKLSEWWAGMRGHAAITNENC